MEAKIKELERSIRSSMAKITANDLGEISMSVYMRKAYEDSIDRDSEALERLKAAVEQQKALARRPKEFTRYDLEDWLTELHISNLYSFEDRQHLISTYVKQVIVYDDSMEVILNTPGDISDPQNAELTVACAKTYTDFRNENVDVDIPEELEITEAEAEEAIAKLIDSDDDDDPDDPKGGGGGKRRSPSGGGSSSGGKYTKSHNTEASGTAKNSADIKKSSFKQGGEPREKPVDTSSTGFYCCSQSPVEHIFVKFDAVLKQKFGDFQQFLKCEKYMTEDIKLTIRY